MQAFYQLMHRIVKNIFRLLIIALGIIIFVPGHAMHLIIPLQMLL